MLSQEAGVYDKNLSDRTFTVANDVFTIEKFLAEVCISILLIELDYIIQSFRVFNVVPMIINQEK
jgi:hypothetical protein